MVEPKRPRRIGPGSAAGTGRPHHIEAVAHHFLAEPDVPVPEDVPCHLLVATGAAGRATAAWTARLVRALVGADGLVATDDRLASGCAVSERAGLQWSVGSYFPGREAKRQRPGEPGSELAPVAPGPARLWRVTDDVPVDPPADERWIHHLGVVDEPYLDWSETALPEAVAFPRHLLWCVGGDQAESWGEAHRLGRLLLACGAERLTVVQLPSGWPASETGRSGPWKRRLWRRVTGPAPGPAADRLAARVGASAPQVRTSRWSWEEGRAAGSSRRWRRLLCGD